ncbi:uncharacterized protein Dana_GF26762 [Drosophila ananassae]|uniref:SCP domain-containing protein n=1 Tax=Drosophila ananassae TaxID=7217 RepID=A0A0N8P1K9_DROAN|nr:uncharacterized protein Dana_GF26762 [Drosophila ananassae]
MFWSPRCGKRHEGVGLTGQRDYILKRINTFRQRVMNGKVPTLPRAKKLTPLSWDDDLWILAMRVSNQCQDTLEGFCINTHRFRKAGETSDFMVLRPGVFPDMISFTDKWIAAAQKLSPEDVDSFPQNPNPLVMAAGNLLNEKNRYIGCGMLSAIGRINPQNHTSI